MFKFELGSILQDRVSGFQGMTTSRTQYLNGCRRYGVTPEVDKDGKLQETEWFDEQQLEKVADRPMWLDAAQTAKLSDIKLDDQPQAAIPGGPRQAPRGVDNPR